MTGIHPVWHHHTGFFEIEVLTRSGTSWLGVGINFTMFEFLVIRVTQGLDSSQHTRVLTSLVYHADSMLWP